MRENLMLPIGSADFEDIRTKGKYFVDKSLFIRDVLTDGATTLSFTRPRRFGKSLNMSMISTFLDIRKDSRSLFEGLKIMEEKEIVEEHLNKHPVLFMSFKDISASNYEKALEQFKLSLNPLFASYEFLVDDLKGKDREIFENMLSLGSEPIADPDKYISLIANAIYRHYGKKLTVLIDEYDVPLDKAFQKGYYTEMLEMLKSIFARLLKDNSIVELSLLTGCLRISKESLFTGLNNFATFSLASPYFASSFGFTEEEVDRLLLDADLTEKKEIIEKWYDGYRIGKEKIHAPWDVLYYIKDLLKDKSSNPGNYWANTSENNVVKNFIEQTNANIADDYTALINMEPIRKKITENLTHVDLYDKSENIWSLLFETGYLTLLSQWNENEENLLKLPNEEIRQLFINSVNSWFKEKVKSDDLSGLYSALWEKDSKTLSDVLTHYLEKTISYNDYSEDFYHAFTTALFATSPYRTLSNRESGNGRYDLAIADIDGKRAAIFEFKVAKKENDIEKKLKEARKQIDEKEYDIDFRRYSVSKIAVCFFKKSAISSIS